jgi:hypothetical protein
MLVEPTMHKMHPRMPSTCSFSFRSMCARMALQGVETNEQDYVDSLCSCALSDRKSDLIES